MTDKFIRDSVALKKCLKETLGNHLLLPPPFIPVKDSDKSQEVFARPTPSTSIIISTKEPDAPKKFQLVLAGSKSEENSCGLPSVTDQFFGALTTETMFGLSSSEKYQISVKT
jgi:hypothetical protein